MVVSRCWEESGGFRHKDQLCAGLDLSVACCLAGLLLTCSPLAQPSERKTRRVAGTWRSSTWWKLSCPSLKAFMTSCRWALQMSVQDWYQSFFLLPELCSLPSAEVTAPLTLCEPSRGCTGISQGGGFAQQR